MKIAILGSLYFNVTIDLESEFDYLGINRGPAKLSFGGPVLDLAKNLINDGHEVVLVSSINSSLHVPVCTVLKQVGLTDEFIVWESNGIGFRVDAISSSTRKHTFESNVCGEYAIKSLEDNADTVFKDLDILVTDYVEPRAWELAVEYATPLAWLADPDDLARYDCDDADLRYYNFVPVISSDDYKEVIK